MSLHSRGLVVNGLSVGLVLLLINLLALQIGCEKVQAGPELGNGKMADQAVTQTGSSGNQETAAGETTDLANENGGAMDKASRFLNQAKSSGGDASKWVQQKLKDASDTSSETAQDTAQWANEMYRSLKDQGLTTAGSAGEWVSNDWNRMGAWEYKVIRLSGDEVQLEAKLNELGADRWECFHIDNGVMYFKKPAKSYLKNIPFRDMMKLIPLMDAGAAGE